MKISLGCSLAVCLAILIPSLASADLSMSSAPSSDLIASSGLANGGIGSRIFDIDANANHVRGQLFTPDDGGAATAFNITSIGFEAAEATSYDGGARLELAIFEGTEAQFTTGTGRTSDTGSFYDGTTVTPLYFESFSMDGLNSVANQFYTMELAAPVTVNEGTSYGFLLAYIQGTTGPTSIFYLEGSSGDRLSIDASSHVRSSRTMDFFVVGTAIPEPGCLSFLALVGLGAVTRRRR